MPFADTFRAIKRFGRPLKPYLAAMGSHTYGQYGEDALVFSALKPSRRGFYVDVGAYDPLEGSNTYKLYQRGWRGLTIEPNPKPVWKFKLLRGGDTHLTMGVAAAPETLKYYEFDIAMLNTMDGDRAKALDAEGHKIVRTREIPCERLDKVLAERAPGKHIDLLNVDCEGADLTVLQTIDFVEHRPTVIIMEDLDAYYGMRNNEGASAIMQFMAARGYAPIARLVYSTVYVALDWRELNKRSNAYREAAIHPGLLPEGDVPKFSTEKPKVAAAG